MRQTAETYGMSEETLYRLLRSSFKPKTLKRADHGKPRILSSDKMEYYCEIIAAIRTRTTNKKNRHLSTAEAIRLMEDPGVQTDDTFVKIPKGLLNKSTVNRYLKLWGFDFRSINKQPPSVRFQAQHSNDCWHFDMSPSDLKYIKCPPWVRTDSKRPPILMLYSVVDDRSGVSYQEYHCVYGEDIEAALRFLYNAMSPKDSDGLPFQGIPKIIYTDNGPVARSHLFHQVMEYLGVEVRSHLPKGSDGRRITARSKGKVERPFRSVKEMHETLYHFHQPETESQANQWLIRFLVRYNSMQHRAETHSRIDDWQKNIPKIGLRSMCSWEKFCSFAREPEQRKVGNDSIVSIHGMKYHVSPELAGDEVTLWWGLLDQEMFVEAYGKKFGPFFPSGGPIPLGHYRNHKKTKFEKRSERVDAIAKQLKLPREAMDGGAKLDIEPTQNPKLQKFTSPDPFVETNFASVIKAKLAISEYLNVPLAKLDKLSLIHI